MKSNTEQIRETIATIKQGEPFTANTLLTLNQTLTISRKGISGVLSRLVKEGIIERAMRGVFFKPIINRFVGRVPVDTNKVLELIAKEHNEILQTHGAEAVRRFQLSTQVPMRQVYYTSGSSRVIKINNTTVKLIHTSNKSILQHVGSKIGVAISALLYMGKNNTSIQTIEQIYKGLKPSEFNILCTSNIPQWLLQIIHKYRQQHQAVFA